MIQNIFWISVSFDTFILNQSFTTNNLCKFSNIKGLQISDIQIQISLRFGMAKSIKTNLRLKSLFYTRTNFSKCIHQI